MNLNDFLTPPKPLQCKNWQLGKLLKKELPQDGIALVFVSDFRGANGDSEKKDFNDIRKEIYQLSALDFSVPIYDFGDLTSGKTTEDTSYALQEILSLCHYKNTIPLVIGGSCDLSYALFSALHFHQKEINYSQISNVISLENEGETVNENNFLGKIFANTQFSIQHYYHLGYQKHLSELDAVNFVKKVDFEILRLSEMLKSTTLAEPYFRRAHLATINADAIESFASPFSIRPQVNGLNRREICAYMKEIGLSNRLKSFGLFNLELNQQNELNQQLIAQMIWYLIEGINIQKTHPKNNKLEQFWVMVDKEEYAFQRDVFTGLWYFGESENMEQCLPCSPEDYEMAKRGILNPRLMKFIN